jgi:hypothetical protein
MCNRVAILADVIDQLQIESVIFGSLRTGESTVANEEQAAILKKGVRD